MTPSYFVGDVPQPIFVFAEVLGDLGIGGDVMDLVDVRGHAARAEISDAGLQFQGRSSSSRWAGWAAMRARTSVSHACASVPFIFAVTMRLYMAAARRP